VVQSLLGEPNVITDRDLLEESIGFAARHLAKSDKGRDALRRVLDWLESSGLSLDGQNQNAILELQRLAFEGWAGTVRDAMHAALAAPTPGREGT
jgi:hypothetical protein